MADIRMPLGRDLFGPEARLLVEAGELRATAFTYPSGVEGLRLENTRGQITVLPFLGQMIWEAVFDGRDLRMTSAFPWPRRGASIIETYGAFVYHAGILKNGTPGPKDTHALHGEMPVAEMERATLILGQDAAGPFIEVQSEIEYIRGFGPHYLARPQARLHAGRALFNVVMEAENRSTHPMELMYLLHANFAFVPGAEIHQPAPWTPEAVKVRQAIPSHVVATPAFRALLDDLAVNPARMRKLSEPDLYFPEQVFYVTGLARGADGMTEQVMALPEGDGFSLAHDPQQMPHCVRWIMNDGDAKVAAFALPATCEPEGYTAEKAKGNVQEIAPGATRRFAVTLGHLDRNELPAAIARVAALPAH